MKKCVVGVVLLLVLWASVAHGVSYSTTANFQLKTYENSMYAPLYIDNLNVSGDVADAVRDPLRWDMQIPQEGLTSYYVELSTSPFTIDTGGTITVSLASPASLVGGDDGDAGVPDFGTSTYLDYVKSYLITTAEVENGTLGALWNAKKEFFFLNQPRLHCLLNAPFVSAFLAAREETEGFCAVNTTGVNTSSKAADTIDELYMLNEAVLEFKVFQWDVWFSLTENLRLDNATRASLDAAERSTMLIDALQNHRQPFNLLMDSAKACSVPAMYTIGLNNLISAASAAGSSGGKTEWPTSIVIKHAGLPQRIVAVLVQCSAVPVTVRVDVTFMNPHEVGASLETYFTAIMYFVFMSAYALLFVVYLTLIISCKRRRSSSSSGTAAALQNSSESPIDSPTMTSEKRSMSGSGSGRGRSRDARSRAGTPEDDAGSAKSAHHRRAARDRERRRDGSSSSYRRDGNHSRHSTRRNDADDKHSPHRRHSHWREAERDVDHVDGTDALCGGGCCAPPNIFTRFRDFVVRFYRTHTIIIMADGRLQWMVFVTMPVKCLMCIFFAASYSVINSAQLSVVSTVASLPFISLALGVAVGTILFALEVLVAVGWGLAFKQLTTAQIVVLAIGCILFFVFDVGVVSSCPVQGRLDAFTANVYAQRQASTTCLSFQYTRYAVVLIFHVYNAVQIFLVTRLLGRRAVREHRELLLRGGIPAGGERREVRRATTRSVSSSSSRNHADRSDSQRRRRERQRRRDGGGQRHGRKPQSPRARTGAAAATAAGELIDEQEALHSFGSTASDSDHDEPIEHGPGVATRHARRRQQGSSGEASTASGSFSRGPPSLSSSERSFLTSNGEYSGSDGSTTDASTHTFSTSSYSEDEEGEEDVSQRRHGSSRHRASRTQRRQADVRQSSIAAEGGLFPAEDPDVHLHAALRSVESMKLFLRFHGMRYPFMFLVLWHLLFLVLSFTMYDPEHFYMKVLFDEVGCLYLLCFIILFFRKEPFYC